jgi:hypothetical protein
VITQIAAPAKASPEPCAGPEQRLTDVLMFNSRNLGALIVQEEPHVKSWEDGQYNIQNMSIEETYGFGILQEGQAVAVAKNVKIRPNTRSLPLACNKKPARGRARLSPLYPTPSIAWQNARREGLKRCF